MTLDSPSNGAKTRVELPASSGEVTLREILAQADPLIRQWTEAESEKHRRELELENEKHRREIELERLVLRFKRGQTLLLGWGLLGIMAAVLAIAGGLFWLGRDTTAMELIKLVGVGTLGAFGGYGLGKTKGREEAERK